MFARRPTLPALPEKIAQPLRKTSAAMGTGYLRLGKTHLQRMLVLSVVLHALVLVVRFVPDDILKRWDKEALLVVLVNSSGDEAPSEAQALANATLRGGGESDAGMVKSPLINMGAVQDGDDLTFLQKQVSILEKEQASLLAMLKGQSNTQAPSGTAQQFNPKTGTAAQTNSAPLMREIAALDKNIEDYNKRPKRKFISPATREAAFATYFALWSDRTERLGTEFYPEAARGKFAEVTVTVSVRKDGSIEDLILEKSSGDKAIDRGALRLLKRLAPYPAFKGALRQSVDVLDITTKLIFTPAGELTAQMMTAPSAPTSAPAKATSP
jgi:periplasmic protein TonB